MHFSINAMQESKEDGQHKKEKIEARKIYSSEGVIRNLVKRRRWVKDRSKRQKV